MPSTRDLLWRYAEFNEVTAWQVGRGCCQVFQTMFIQMPCFRCCLVNVSKGLHPPSLVTGSCSCEKEFLLSAQKRMSQKRLRFFLFAWSEDKVTEATIAMIPPTQYPTSGRRNVSIP